MGNGGTSHIGSFELKPFDQATADLYDLAEHGFTVLLASDLDWQYQPWLIDRDGGVWIHDAGMPAAGYRAETHDRLRQPGRLMDVLDGRRRERTEGRAQGSRRA